MDTEKVQLPRLKVVTMTAHGLLIGYHDSLWVGENWIGCIIPKFGTIIWGRFIHVDKTNKKSNFIFNRPDDASSFEIGKEYEYLDGYWGERVEIVIDSSLNWEKTEFLPRDAVKRFANGTTQVVIDGWDHEHCEICGIKISCFEGEQKYGYKNQKNRWICENCYKSFIEVKSINFVKFGMLKLEEVNNARPDQGL